MKLTKTRLSLVTVLLVRKTTWASRRVGQRQTIVSISGPGERVREVMVKLA